MHRFLALSIIAVSSGCAPLVKEVNQRWPPVSPAEHQAKAVAEAQSSLRRVTKPTGFVSVNSSILPILSEEIKKAVTAAYPKEPRPAIEKLELRTGKQEVVVRLIAQVPFDDGRSTLGGYVEAHAAVSTDSGDLVLRPSFSNVTLTRATYRGHGGRGLAVDLANAAIRTFLNNLNGAIASRRISLRTANVLELNPKDVKIDAPPNVPGASVTVDGSVVRVDMALGQTALLIDSMGISGLADVFAATRTWLDSTAFSLRQKLGTVGGSVQLTSEEIALLGFCRVSPPVVADLPVLCTAADERTRGPVASPGTNPRAFEEYEAEFVRRRATLADGMLGASVGVSLDRERVAAAVNAHLAGAAGSIAGSLPALDLPDFKSTLRLPPTTQLNCDAPGRFGGCNSDFDKWHNERFGSYNPRGCPSDCCPSIWKCDLGCVAEEKKCKLTEALEKGAYETAKAARKVQFGAEKLACETKIETEKQGCKLNQAWLDKWDNRDIGEVKASAKLRNTAIRLDVSEVGVGPALDSIFAKASLSGSVDVSADLTLTPHNEGHLLCWGEWKGQLSTNASLTTLTPQFKGTLENTLQGNWFRIDPMTFKLTLDPPPLKKLLLDEAGEFFMKCPLPSPLFGAVMMIAPHVIDIDGLAGTNSRDFTTPLSRLPIKIPSNRADVGGRAVDLGGQLTQQTLLFTATVTDVPPAERVAEPGTSEWPWKAGVLFSTSAGAFGRAEAAPRKDIAVPFPFVAWRLGDQGLRAFASFTAGPNLRGIGPQVGLAWRPSDDLPLLVSLGLRIPSGLKNRDRNPVRLMFGIGYER